MADIKKFLDQSGVSVLWTRIADELAAEKARAEAAEAANAAAAKSAQDDVDALETYVGSIPETYTESNIVAYIQKVAVETLAAASGNSNETAASVAQALADYKALNDPKVQENADNIATIMGDYLTSVDKEELAGNIAANATEITRIDNTLKAAIENEGEGLDSIKELATWIEAHGAEAAGYAAAISALELLVGDKAVATQIAEAIANENLDQYATDEDLTGATDRIAALENKVDTGDKTVTAAINAAIEAIGIGDYAKAADLTALAARVATLETNDADKETRIAAMEAKVANWDAAEANANAYTNAEIAKIQALTEDEIDSAIASATNG